MNDFSKIKATLLEEYDSVEERTEQELYAFQSGINYLIDYLYDPYPLNYDIPAEVIRNQEVYNHKLAMMQKKFDERNDEMQAEYEKKLSEVQKIHEIEYNKMLSKYEAQCDKNLKLNERYLPIEQQYKRLYTAHSKVQETLLSATLENIKLITLSKGEKKELKERKYAKGLFLQIDIFNERMDKYREKIRNLSDTNTQLEQKCAEFERQVQTLLNKLANRNGYGK